MKRSFVLWVPRGPRKRSPSRRRFAHPFLLPVAGLNGMAIRFKESDARPMGRNSSGVRGISLVGDDRLVGMVVAQPEATLLTACANGYGKRTLFGIGSSAEAEDSDEASSTSRYRTQKRGGKGVRDIKTTKRNGSVIGIARVTDADEVMIMTARGKIQRIAASDLGVIGRNTQGVRIMSIDSDDALVAVVRVPGEENAQESDDDPLSKNTVESSAVEENEGVSSTDAEGPVS